MYCSIKLHTTDQTTPHPLLFSPEKLKFWQHGGIHLPAALYQFTVGCGSRGGPPPHPPTLCHTHAYQSPCSIIEICIIHESFKSFQSTCDSQTLPLSYPPHKMPAVQLPTVWLPAEEEARVHPSDPSNIHMKKSRRVEVLQTARISPG